MSATRIATIVSIKSSEKLLLSNAAEDGVDLSDDESEAEYQNPLYDLPRWRLATRASLIRYGATLGFGFANFSTRAANKNIWLDTTLTAEKSKIRVDIWYPPGVSVSTAQTNRASRPAVINFHGGGFILGQGTDDARWAADASASLGAVVFSVNYRLAPTYPFPTAAEDCADSILQIVARAGEFGIDPQRVFISGFSAGGNLALASWLLLNTPETWGYKLPVLAPPSIAGFALFYPTLNFTITRQKKRATVSRPELTLSSALTDLFDASYVYPRVPTASRTDLRMSPGLMDDELADKLPPVHFCVCEHDMLTAEVGDFVERLKGRGNIVSSRTVLGEPHAWDKAPTLSPKPNVGEEYRAALETMKTWPSYAGICPSPSK